MKSLFRNITVVTVFGLSALGFFTMAYGEQSVSALDRAGDLMTANNYSGYTSSEISIDVESADNLITHPQNTPEYHSPDASVDSLLAQLDVNSGPIEQVNHDLSDLHNDTQ